MAGRNAASIGGGSSSGSGGRGGGGGRSSGGSSPGGGSFSFSGIAGNSSIKDVQGAFNSGQKDFVIINYSGGVKQVSGSDGQGFAQVREVKKRSGGTSYEVKAVSGPSRGKILAKDYSSPVNAFESAYNYARSSRGQ